MQKLRPILFNTEMVKAILTGRKTVTRRVVRPQPVKEDPFWQLGGAAWSDTIDSVTPVPCHSLYDLAPFHPGDILYVRETWSFWPCYDCDSEMCYGRGISYKDTDGCFVYKTQRSKVPYEEKWKPSIHMPKEAARIFLKVTRVRLQRLRDISPDQCAAEGIDLFCGPADARESYYISSFAALWDTTIHPEDIQKYGWEANPWVWVIEFEKCNRPEGV